MRTKNPTYLFNIASAVGAVPPAGWLTKYQDVAGGIRGFVLGGGLLKCEAQIEIAMNSAPAYTCYFQWVIDGIGSVTGGYHAYVSLPSSVMQSQYQRITVRGLRRLPYGLHAVGLQARSDSAGVNSPFNVLSATAEFV